MKKLYCILFFFFQAEDGIRDGHVTGVQTCALPISARLIKREAPAEGPGTGVPPSEGDAPAGLADESKVVAGEPGAHAAARETAAQEATDAPPSEELAEPRAAHEVKAPRSSKESRWYRPI